MFVQIKLSERFRCQADEDMKVETGVIQIDNLVSLDTRQTFHYIQQQIDNYRDNFEHEKKNRP